MAKKESKFVSHARFELNQAGAFNKTKDYDGGLGRGILAMVKLFVQWTNGEKAKMEAMAMGFTQLIAGELLSPPTTNPDEWEPVPGASPGTVRNKRSPFYLSTDNGKTWTHIQNQETGSSANHIKKEDSDGPIQQENEKATGAGQDTVSAPVSERRDAGETASNEDTTDAPGSSGADDKGRELDPGVAKESVEDQAQSQDAPDQPEARTDS